MIHVDKYENYSASDYYDAVTLLSSNAAEAVYYLLKYRLAKALERVFELHGFGLDDHYDDTIDDFFLYLYEYEDGQPFAIFGTVREKQAFFGWIVGTYRNFLLNKAKDEVKRREWMEMAGRTFNDEERSFSNEILTHYIATAIAFAVQELPPLKLFIFYRMLLTIIDPMLAVPQEAMAQVLGMHPVTYRVCVNRLKSKLSKHVAALEGGQALPLDSAHLLMSHCLFRGFDHLYEALMPYYEAAVKVLPMALEIHVLRNGYGDGITMHEELEYSYPHVVDVRELYNRLKS